MDTNTLNNSIRDWGVKTNQHLKDQFSRLKIEHRENSPSPTSAQEELKTALTQRQGMISKISFKFPRHMVFVAKGVGKGVPIALAGSSKTTRKAKDWFNSVIEEDIEDLADVVANNQADMIVNSLFIN